MSATSASATIRLIPTAWIPSLYRRFVAVWRSRSRGVSVMRSSLPLTCSTLSGIDLSQLYSVPAVDAPRQNYVRNVPHAGVRGGSGTQRAGARRRSSHQGEQQVLGLLQVGARPDLPVEAERRGQR